MNARTAVRTIGAFLLLALLFPANLAITGPAAAPTLEAAGRGYPYVNLADGQPVPAVYHGAAALAVQEARPLALAGADFDDDGYPDLAAGYAGPGGGLVAFYHGNRAFYEAPAGLGLAPGAAFQPDAQVYALPEPADLLAVGDFDADGRPDLVAAARGGATLYLLAGDGAGGLGAPAALALPGPVTALAAGDVNRRDGLEDLLVGVGTTLLVYEGSAGAWRAAPESFPLPAAPMAVAFGQLDDDYPIDIAVAAGSELLIVAGRDRKLTWPAAHQAAVGPAEVRHYAQPAAVLSLALGDFYGADGGRREIALLLADGTLRVLDRAGVVGATHALPQAGTQLLRTKVSSLPADELLVLDPAGQQLSIIAADGRRLTAEGYTPAVPAGTLAALDLSAAPAAVLPLRLNVDALTDLVVLAAGAPAPLVVPTQPVHTFIVETDAYDATDWAPGDGVCEISPANPRCALRTAIAEANASAGADAIIFVDDLEIFPRSPLPDIVDPVTIDGSGSPGHPNAKLNATRMENRRGLIVLGGASTLRSLTFNEFHTAAFIGTEEGNYLEYLGIHDLISSGITIWNSSNTVAYCDIVGLGNNNAAIVLGVASVGGNADENTIMANNLRGDIGVLFLQAENNTVRDNEQIRGGIQMDCNPFSLHCSGNLLRGNVIGDLAWNVPVPQPGVLLRYAANNNIGIAADPNAILGNRHGILIETAESYGNQVQGNYIGIPITGAAVVYNSLSGVSIQVGAHDNLIGGVGVGNAIAKNYQHGIEILGPEGGGVGANLILGNYIGTDPSGAGGRGNSGHGIYIQNSGQNEIGAAAGGGNVIVSNQGCGIWLDGTHVSQTVVQRNVIGIGEDSSRMGNSEDGVRVSGGVNTIGGTAAGAGNTISGNYGHGIHLIGVDGAAIQGNTIGTDLAGGTGVGNTLNGIYLNNSSDNVIGGAAAGAGNLISGNGSDGIEVRGSGNTIAGNTIGADAAGQAAIGNVGPGVWVASGSNNTIGGTEGTTPGWTCSGACNLLSGNGRGVELAGAASGNTVICNSIGTDRAGTAALGNNVGVRIAGSNNTIGGPAATYRNLVSGNLAAGIDVRGGTANTIQGNWIGAAYPAGGLPNGGPGIALVQQAHDNLIGGASAGMGNDIAYNGGGGIVAESGVRNEIVGNAIWGHPYVPLVAYGLGIDLAPAWVSQNDPGDLDSGPNNLQNYPLIATVLVSTSAEIQGALNSTPHTAFRVDLYRNDVCDDSGYGEGQQLFESVTVTTDAAGNTGFHVTIAGTGLYGKYVTAVATDPDGNTSEFSPCVLGTAAERPPIVVNQTADGVDPTPADGVCDVEPGTPGEQCTLRAAVETADAVVGADVILVPAGTYLLTLEGTGDTAGDLDIQTDMAIRGAGASVTVIQSTVADRVVQIFGAATVVEIAGVTLAGGTQTSTGGGGIYNPGKLTLDAVTVRDNETSYTGGGIYNAGALTVTDSAIVSNTAGMDGGGIRQFAGTTVLANSTVAFNSAADNGGGIAASDGTVWLNNVTVAYNTADTDEDGGDGGGLYRSGGITFTASNSIVGENVDRSGGDYPYGAADCAGTFGSRGYSLISDRGYNRNSGAIACLGFDDDDTNIVGGFYLLNHYIRYATGLAPYLSANGGSTPNLALFSPYYGVAIDTGNPAEPGSGPDACVPADQRGQPRPVDGNSDDTPRCDMGAFEYVPVTMSIGDAAVGESGTAVLEVTLAQPAGITITVEYSTTAETAAAGLDFTPVSGTLTFVIGADTQTISVPVLADTWDEDDETFYVTLYDPSFVFLGKAQGVVTILDDDDPPEISIGDVTVGEDEPTAVVTVTLSSPSGHEVTVELETDGDTARAGEDYGTVVDILTFPAGTAALTVSIPILGDNLDESDEIFYVGLNAPTNATIADGQAIVTIADDDTAALSAHDASLPEGISGTASMYLAVRLEGPSVQTVTVAYATADGTARAGSDYAAAAGVLTFAPGETLRYVAVTVYGDEEPEPNETFFLNLGSPTGGAVLFDGQGTATILDDDRTSWMVFLPAVYK